MTARQFNFPARVPPITSTIVLPHCWVCHLPFEDECEIEHHHVIPSHLGGNLGPTVSLCEICHTKAHKMSYY